jgi:hypothetical protein
VGLWNSVRREVIGVVRSARYDVNRHVGMHRAKKLCHADTAEFAVREIRTHHRRRMVTAGGVGLLVAGGAAGTYLAVVGSIAALTAGVADQPPAPVAAPAARQATSSSHEASAGELPRRAPATRSDHRTDPAPVGLDDQAAEQEPDSVITAWPIPESTSTESTSPTPSPSESQPSIDLGDPSPSVSDSSTPTRFHDHHGWRHRKSSMPQTGSGQ